MTSRPYCMAAEKIVSINVDAPNPRSAYSGSLPVFTLGNTLRMRVELYDDGELAAFDTSKDYVFALGLSGRATGGNYILSYGADSTPELSAAASPSDVESALNALAGVSGAGGVKVVGVAGGPYKIFWKTAGARDQIAAKNTLYPDAYVYSSPIVSGDDSTAAQQAIAFKLSLLSSMSNVSYLDVDRTTSTTKYVEVEKPVSVTTKTTVTDPETGETTTTETTETRTETVTEAQVETVTESIKGAMEFDLSLATVEALMALGGSASISALAEFAEISDGGETATLLQAECTILSNVIPDAATLTIASQELANMTAAAKFYAIGTNDTPPSIVAGTVPNEADKGSAYYYAQLAANSGADAETSKTSAADSATQAAGAAEDADTSKNTAVSAANGATAAAQASAQSETNAASSASSAQASATNAAQSEANALASKNAAEAAAQIAQETDAGELMLSKLGAGQLWFNRGVLSVPSFANLSISLPISLCIEYDVDSWSGLGITTNGGIMFLATRDVEYTTPAQFKGFYLRYYEDKSLIFHCANADSTPLTAQFSALTTNRNDGLPTGRHTLAVCVGGEISGGRPSHFAWYLDGIALSQTIIQQTMTASDITSTRPLAVAQADNYSNPSLVGGAKVPVRLSRAKIFNFALDTADAPYTVADYAAGRAVPPALLNPSAEQRALLALEDYTIAVGATRYVPDVSGNAYDATVVESGGSGDAAWTGTVKGSRDTAIKRLCDLFNANNQSV